MRTTITELKEQAAYLTELLHSAGIEKTAFVLQENGMTCIAMHADDARGNVVERYITDFGTKSEVHQMACMWARGFNARQL